MAPFVPAGVDKKSIDDPPKGKNAAPLVEVLAKNEESDQLKKIQKDSGNVSREHVQGLMSQVLKSALFNPGGALDATSMDTA